MQFQTKLLDTATEPPSRVALYRQSVWIGAGVFAVLAVFQPFGTYVFQHELKYLVLAGYGLLVPLTAFVLRESLALFRPAFFAPGAWTFRRELVFSGVFLLAAVVLSYFYQRLALGGRLSWIGFFSFIFYASLIAVLPLSFFLVWRFFEVKNRIMSQALAEKIADATPPSPPMVRLQGENKHEQLTLVRSEILYLRAADNYVEIFLQKNGQTQRLLLRGALSALLLQLEKTGPFQQVHRSFVVNLEPPVRLDGKSPNYFLVFDHAPDAGAIPVSRSAVAELRALLAAKPR